MFPNEKREFSAVPGWRQIWHGPLTVQSLDSPLKVFKQSANNFLAVTSFWHSGPLQAALVYSPIRRKFLFLQNFKI